MSDINEEIEWLRAVLRCIAQPGKQITYCQDGHEAAVLIARDALSRSEDRCDCGETTIEDCAHRPTRHCGLMDDAVSKPVDNLSCGGSGSCCQGPCKARW